MFIDAISIIIDAIAMIIASMKKNYHREVEEFLHTHPDVSEAQVRFFLKMW